MGDWNAINSQVPYQLLGGDGGSGGDVTNGENIGPGAEVFAQKVGTILQFRTVVGGPGITIAQIDPETIQVSAKARSRAGSTFDGHTPWKLPNTFAKIANLVTAPSGFEQDFLAGGDGTFVYTGTDTKVFSVHATISVRRTAGVNATGQLTIAAGSPAAVLTGVAQELRFSLTGASEVIDVQALVQLDTGHVVEFWADTDAPPLGQGLTVQIVGFAATITEA